MSSRRIVAIFVVALLHVLIGYAFISGLALDVAKKLVVDTKVFDVTEEPPPPPDEPPPPPPDQPQQVQPPPLVTPPPLVQTNVPPPITMQSVTTPPPVTIVTPTAPVISTPAPPAAPTVSKAAAAKGDPAQWITNDDYPPAANREGRGGTTAIAWDINSQGRVENCRVTQSSGSDDLDQTACRVLTRRGRYTPARDASGNPIVSHASRRVRWEPPRD